MKKKKKKKKDEEERVRVVYYYYDNEIDPSVQCECVMEKRFIGEEVNKARLVFFTLHRLFLIS